MRGEWRQGWGKRLLAVSLGGVFFLGLAESGWGAVRANLENPAPGQSVAGISVVSGWAFSTTSGATITQVRLRVDGAPVTTIPCCSGRADVAAVFGSQALNSGFGLLQNYGLSSPGLHTIGVEVEDSTGNSAVIDYSVTVIKPGGFEFLDEFDLSAAVVSREDQTVVVEEITIRDKASGQIKTIDASFRWAENCQCLVMVESAETGSVKSVTGQLTLGSDTAEATFTVNPAMGQIGFSIKATSPTFFLCTDVFGIVQGSQEVELTDSADEVNEDTALISFEGDFNGCDTISQGTTVVNGTISEFPAPFDLKASFQIVYGDSMIAVE